MFENSNSFQSAKKIVFSHFRQISEFIKYFIDVCKQFGIIIAGSGSVETESGYETLVS
jgi:hypothetical protein